MSKKEEFQLRLNDQKPLISDGAMGTVLHQRGVSFDGCFDALNIDNPKLVQEIHKEYILAGSQIIQTNTFGANRNKLSRYHVENKIAEINTAGVNLVRETAKQLSRDILIAADVGPLGKRLAPFGKLSPEEARDLFSEQISALVSADPDLIIIETMTDLYEIKEAVLAAQTIAPHLPIIASMTFTRDDRTLLGDPPIKVAKTLNLLGVDVIGINCSSGPNQLLRILKQMKHTVPEAKFSVMPNAGFPESVGGRVMYSAGPEYFGDYAISFWEAGANILGGCCGTTPQHISAISHMINTQKAEFSIEKIEIKAPTPEENEELEIKPTELARKISAGEFVISVEMDPPRGLSTHKLLAGASLLAEAGADVINVADSPLARMRMSPWAVCNLLQKKVPIETVLHFPTRGRNLLRVQGDLLAAHALNVRNIFVVMGDPTSIGDYPNAMNDYDLVPSGLIKLIKQNFNIGIDHAGSDIGQPTSFFVGCALNLNPAKPEIEFKNLHRKLTAGADFLLTQPVYDPVKAKKFVEQYNNEHDPISVPILVGTLPLASNRHANFLHQEVPGITIPDHIRKRMEQAGDKGAKTGVNITIELVEQLKDFANGTYIMPAFNRFDLVAEIIENTK